MINAIIIEDEKSSMEYLASILKQNHKNINILGWASDVATAVELISTKSPDIVFLDIQLNDGNGFEVLDKLSNRMTFEVIFTTGFLNYKEKAMDYFAFYYLIKPVQKDEIERVLNVYEQKRSFFDIKKYEAFKNQLVNKDKLITIYDNGEYFPLRLSNIIYCEASGNYSIVCIRNRDSVLISKHLKQIEDMVESEDFLRVHRSYLINSTHIKKFSRAGELVMSNNEKILVSTRNRKKVVDFLKNHHNREF